MRNNKMKNKMKQVNVPQTLIKMSKLPSIAEKMMLLDTIGNHPVAPYVCNGVAELMNYHMKRNDSQRDMLNTINIFLVELSKKFNK
jgi:hypothetical protein